MKLHSFLLATVLSAASLLASPASAGGWWHLSPKCDPDSVGSGVVTVTDGITGNFFSFDVDYEVFAADNCANPKPVKGSYTYIYTVTFADEGPIPGLALDELRVEIANAVYLVDTGYLTGGPGVVPSSVDVVNAPARSVTATFAPGSLALGDTSLPIFVVSPYQPGAGVVNLKVSFLTGAGAALVPQSLPQACPCTTSYWALRITGWPFFLFDFPGAQLDQVKQRAVELSGGFFSSKTDLVNALLYPGLLDLRKKAKRELAALLLNVAAGDLFPANTKCRLFLGSELDQDGDGVADSIVVAAIGSIESEIQAGDLFSLLDALSMAAQINSGQDVLGMALFH
jgi:hypothetical protein